ncbi:MAG: rRNA maturation RNase YbeY [Pseudomonadota bacterium]
MNLVVDVQYALDDAAADGLGVPAPAQFEAWAAAALAGRRVAAELSIRVVDEAEGGELNQTYRQRPGPTNVLSFPFDSPAQLEIPLLGDVVICAPVVAREAREQDKPVLAHWAHMTVHGTLHLLGYDHETPAEADEMERLEARILGGLGYSDPYAAERAAVTV